MTRTRLPREAREMWLGETYACGSRQDRRLTQEEATRRLGGADVPA